MKKGKGVNKVTIVIPVYNEKNTLLEIIKKVQQVELDKIKKEIILVDDYSTDGTREIYKGISNKDIVIILKDKNEGKGAALRTGFKKASGNIIIIQDADLEYDPNEYPILLEPILTDKADVVYGSRFLGARPHRVLYFWHYAANKILTLLSNIFSNINITDMETCYKVFRKEVLNHFELKQDRFGFEPEFTAKISKIKGIRIYEVGISYFGRTYEEGKKIGLKDAIKAVYCIVRYNFFS